MNTYDFETKRGGRNKYYEYIRFWNQAVKISTTNLLLLDILHAPSAFFTGKIYFSIPLFVRLLGTGILWTVSVPGLLRPVWNPGAVYIFRISESDLFIIITSSRSVLKVPDIILNCYKSAYQQFKLTQGQRMTF